MAAQITQISKRRKELEKKKEKKEKNTNYCEKIEVPRNPNEG